jgi:hypothetical protein
MYDALRKKLIPDLQACEIDLHTEPTTILRMLKYLARDRKIHDYIMENLLQLPQNQRNFSQQ